MDNKTMQKVFDKIDDIQKAIIHEDMSVGQQDRLHVLDLLKFDLQLLQSDSGTCEHCERNMAVKGSFLCMECTRDEYQETE